MCVEENRDKGEIKKTKGEENVAEKKRGKKKKRRRCCVGYMCGVGQGHEQFFFFLSKLIKKIYIRVMLSLKYFYNKF